MGLVMHITAASRQERAGMGKGAVKRSRRRSRRFDTQLQMLAMCSSRGSVSALFVRHTCWRLMTCPRLCPRAC